MKNSIAALGVFAALSLTAGSARATLVCSTPGICKTEASFSSTLVNFVNQSLSFDKFDTSLGTLNKVTLTFETTGTLPGNSGLKTEMTTSGYTQNLAGLALNFTMSVSASLATFLDSDFGAISFSINSPNIITSGVLAGYASDPFETTYGCATPYNSVNCSAAVGSGFPKDYVSWVNLTGNTLTGTTSKVLNCPTCDAARFSANGGGNWTLNNIFGSGGFNNTNLPATNAQQAVTQASAVALVQYDYTAPAAVPEPGTYALLGSALLGLVGLRKRLTRKA